MKRAWKTMWKVFARFFKILDLITSACEQYAATIDDEAKIARQKAQAKQAKKLAKLTTSP